MQAMLEFDAGLAQAAWVCALRRAKRATPDISYVAAEAAATQTIPCVYADLLAAMHVEESADRAHFVSLDKRGLQPVGNIAILVQLLLQLKSSTFLLPRTKAGEFIRELADRILGLCEDTYVDSRQQFEKALLASYDEGTRDSRDRMAKILHV